MSNKAPHNAGHHMFASLFADFQVSSEQQLLEKLQKENYSYMLPCSCCGKEFPEDQIRTIDDDPYCRKCAGNCK